MQQGTLKIAISGSAGIGKSTLAADLGADLGLPVIEEHFDPLFAPEVVKGDEDALEQAFWQVLEYKSAREDEAGGFVADRCAIDLFHNWLLRGLGRRPRRSEAFFKACRERFEQLDSLVILPWGAIPLVPLEADGNQRRRVLDPLVQLRNHATIVGYAHMWLPKSRIIEVPVRVKTREARVGFVRKRLEARAGPDGWSRPPARPG